LPADDGVQTWRVTGQQIKNFIKTYYAAKSADYTITDSDQYGLIGVTTSTTNRTMTLPLAANNTDRRITIKKLDNASGQVIIDGNGSETIDGQLTVKMTDQYEAITVLCTGTAWVIESWVLGKSSVECNTPSGYGSTNNKIRKYTNGTQTGFAITYAASGTAGDSFTINVPGVYAIMYVDIRTAGGSALGVSVNSAQLTTGIASITAGDAVLYGDTPSANDPGMCSGTFNFAAGDVVRVHNDGLPDTTSAKARFKILLVKRQVA